MQAFSAGDYPAFEALYQKHKGGLYRYFLRQLGEQSKAEDMFQELWSNVIAQSDDYKTTAKFTTWLYAMARNKVIDHSRHMQVVNKVVDDAADWQEGDELPEKTHSGTPDTGVESDTQAKAIKHCLNQLPHHQRDCFLLKEEAGMQLMDIAEITHASLEATKSRMRYAYKNLRECLRIKLGDWALKNEKRQSA
jgi:RNA polymerase sigma-70 factor (ECF subfamily)